MPKEELMPRCPYCDDEMKYVVLDMVRRTARLHCPTCDSEFPPKEGKMTMTTKPRNRVLTCAEAVKQNKKTAILWLELRDNIPICVCLKTAVYPWRVIPSNIGIGSDNPHTFCSIEPILEPVGTMQEMPDWVIVGAETGNRRGKVVPQKEWIDEIAAECKRHRKPLFMKDSLRDLMGDDFKQEFPWEVDK